MIPRTGRILALDWGTSRIGVAISDETQLIASPIGTLQRRAGKRLPLHDFLTIVERQRPVGLVVGLPLDDESLEGMSAILARNMGETFAARSCLPIEWIDESFSTTEAHHVMIAAGRGRKHRVKEIDAVAAATLLQHWLAARRGESAR